MCVDRLLSNVPRSHSFLYSLLLACPMFSVIYIQLLTLLFPLIYIPLPSTFYFLQALRAALELGHSHRTLKILGAILEQDTPDQSDPFAAGRLLCPFIRQWTVEQLETIAGYLLEWNTNARHCFVSQCLLHSLLETHGATALMKVRGLRLQLTAFIAYSERHFQRVDRLHQAAFLLEYMSSLMSLLPHQEPVSKSSNKVQRIGESSAKSTGANADVEETLDIFGGNSAVHDSDSDSSDIDSDVDMQAAAQSSYSGLVTDDSDDSAEDEDEGDEPVSKSKVTKGTGTRKGKNNTKAASVVATKSTSTLNSSKKSTTAKTPPSNKGAPFAGGKTGAHTGKGKANSHENGQDKDKNRRKSFGGKSSSSSKDQSENKKGQGSAKKRRRGADLSM